MTTVFRFLSNPLNRFVSGVLHGRKDDQKVGRRLTAAHPYCPQTGQNAQPLKTQQLSIAENIPFQQLSPSRETLKSPLTSRAKTKNREKGCLAEAVRPFSRSQNLLKQNADAVRKITGLRLH
jgi:hypothetical protein